MVKNKEKDSSENNDKIIEKYVKHAQEGDEDSFGFIYDIFIEKIYKYVFYRVPEEEAEDVVAEIFIKAWKNIKKYTPQKGARFNSWIFKIAQNSIIDFHRKKKETLELNEDVKDDAKKSLVKEINLKINHESVLKALSHLKENYREIIVMRYLEDLQYSEISKILGKTEGSIRISIMRGLNEIRKILGCNKNSQDNV